MLTVKVEAVPLAEKPLATVSSKYLLNSLIRGQKLSASNLPDELVDGKSHAFLQALYYSYSEHRPFVLTPESIWLLILQAFSAHINNQPEYFLKHYPHFQTKRELIVRDDKVNWENPANCVEIISMFCEGLQTEIDEEFVDALIAKFSNTSLDEQTAFQVTALNTVKPFFEFIVVTAICGIPHIYLAGDQADWLAINARLDQLRKFDFAWFVDQITGIINRISMEFDSPPNDNFWLNIFKIRTLEEYGRPEIVDGWITIFFPYDKKGKRVDETYFQETPFRRVVKDINPQIVELDFKHRLENNLGEIVREIPMLMVAGFLGIEQNSSTLALQPVIGWSIAERDANYIKDQLTKGRFDVLVYHKLTKFPQEVLRLNDLGELELNFIESINIPEELGQLNLRLLKISGQLHFKEKKKIRAIFKNRKTLVLVNGEDVKTRLYHKLRRALLRLSPFHYEYIHY